MGTVLETSHHLVSLDETLRRRCMSAITGWHVCKDTERELLFLLIRFSGIEIPIFYDQAKLEYSNSILTVQVAPLIKNKLSYMQSTRLKSK